MTYGYFSKPYYDEYWYSANYRLGNCYELVTWCDKVYYDFYPKNQENRRKFLKYILKNLKSGDVLYLFTLIDLPKTKERFIKVLNILLSKSVELGTFYGKVNIELLLDYIIENGLNMNQITKFIRNLENYDKDLNDSLKIYERKAD